MRESGSHWGAGIISVRTFNPGVKISWKQYIESNYTNGTSREGLFIYTGNRSDSGSSYGYPSSGSSNFGSISTHMYGGIRLYTNGILEIHPIKTYRRVMSIEGNITLYI